MRKVAALMVVGMLAGGCSTSAGVDRGSGSETTESTARSTSGTTTPSTAITVPAGPVGVADDRAGSLWVASAQASSVSRVRDGRADLTVSGVTTPLRIAAGGQRVWVTSFGSGELVGIDPTSGKTVGRVAVGRGAEGVAVGSGAVWVVAQDDGRLVRVDPGTVKVTGSADIGLGARLVTIGLGSVWVSQFRTGALLRVDPATMTVLSSKQLCGGPQGLAVTPQALWLACTTDNIVVRLDPRTLAVTKRISTAVAPDGITVGPSGTLVVICQQGPTLVTIDPASGAITSSQVLGTQPQLYDQANLDVAVTGDALWVSSFAENLLRRLPLP